MFVFVIHQELYIRQGIAGLRRSLIRRAVLTSRNDRGLGEAMSLKIFEIDRSLESCQGGESRACRNGVNQLANDLPGQIWDRVNGPELSGVQGPKGAKWQKQESDGPRTTGA